jgi:hypothetical protein
VLVQERAPIQLVALGCWRDTSCVQHVSHQRGRDIDPELAQLADDPDIAPASSLSQPGFPFGSGTRTMWFAPGKGLVKLQFKHGDRSVSVVELLR